MTLKYKDININYSDHGKGTAVVLLHGFLENSSMWSNLIPKITKKHRAITIDLLGHGKTDCIGYLHTMEDMANAVNAVTSHLRLRRIILVGHSMGGYVALAYAKRFEDKIKGLCLMNSTYKNDDAERLDIRRRANLMVRSNFNNMIRMSFSNLFCESSKSIYRHRIETALVEALKTPVQGYVACNKGMMQREDQKDYFINAPYKKAIMIGEKDPVIDSKTLEKELKNTDVKIIKFSSGHMSHIENEAEFLQSIMHFIENI